MKFILTILFLYTFNILIYILHPTEDKKSIQNIELQLKNNLTQNGHEHPHRYSQLDERQRTYIKLVRDLPRQDIP